MPATAQDTDRFVDLPACPRLRFRVDGPDDGTPLLLVARNGGARAGAPVARQIGAIQASGDRTAELARITAPTLVVHGDVDRMVHPSGGRATADAIPGARHVQLRGTAHPLAPGVVDRLVELTTDLVRTTAGGTR